MIPANNIPITTNSSYDLIGEFINMQISTYKYTYQSHFSTENPIYYTDFPGHYNYVGGLDDTLIIFNG